MSKPGIPPYGDRFRLVQLRYRPGRLAPRRYELKADGGWYIRSDRPSKRWWIFRRGVRVNDQPFSTLHAAMQQAYSHCCAALLGTKADWNGPDEPDAFFCRECGKTCQRVLV